MDSELSELILSCQSESELPGWILSCQIGF